MGKRVRKKPDSARLINNLYDDLIKHYKELILQLEEELRAEPEKKGVQRYLNKIKDRLEQTLNEREEFNKK